MNLVTFQTMEAFKELIQKGYLICNEQFIDLKKAELPYQWILEKMSLKINNKPKNAKYPLWAWLKYKNSNCPPLHKRKEAIENNKVKITFRKNIEDLLITDFRAYSFVLNNRYIPKNQNDNIWFENELIKRKISYEDLKAYARKDKYNSHRTDNDFLELMPIIRKSWDKCLNKESEVLQACFWKLELNDIIKIEFCFDENYDYGSPNYIRSNGKRPNWIEQYLCKLK